ncbi:MAG TPA: XRE family transcriptional regulator [Bacteroidia bacterium]|nr:XRE family transcriptional regulator [Bacteroidia bacterium]
MVLPNNSISQVAYSKLEKKETKLTVERLYKIAEILKTPVTDMLNEGITKIFHQNNNNAGTFIGNQEVENLYHENKGMVEKIINLYEERLKDKDRLIAQLEK